MELATGAPVTGHIRGGPQHAGDPYFVAVGLSGSTPGTTYLGEIVPIDSDWLVIASAGSSLSHYQGFLGFLDHNGDAVCTLDFSGVAPLPQWLNGYQLTLAAFVWDAAWQSTGEATNHCDVLLR